MKGQGYGGRRREGLSDPFQVVSLFGLGEGEEDFRECGVEDVGGELLQVAVEGVGDEEVEDQSRQQGEGGAKGQAKWSRGVIWAHSEVLKLGKGDVMEELDQELARDVLLVWRESFDDNEDGGGGDHKDEESMDAGRGKETSLNGNRVGQGQMGRFISGSGQEVWHSYGGRLGRQWR